MDTMLSMSCYASDAEGKLVITISVKEPCKICGSWHHITMHKIMPSLDEAPTVHAWAQAVAEVISKHYTPDQDWRGRCEPLLELEDGQ